MPYHVTCVCGRLTVVPDDNAGLAVRCPHCDRILELPRIAAVSPPALPPLPPPVDAAVENEFPVVVPLPVHAPRISPQRIHRERRQLLALALVLLALVSVVPVGLVLAQGATDAARNLLGAQPLDTWALLILLAFLLHLVYVLYLLQVPDWSAPWVVSLFLLTVSTAYAALLGIRLLASAGNGVLGWLDLNRNPFSRSQEVLWCLLMTVLTGTLSYIMGRAAQRWREAGRAEV